MQCVHFSFLRTTSAIRVCARNVALCPERKLNVTYKNDDDDDDDDGGIELCDDMSLHALEGALACLLCGNVCGRANEVLCQ